LKRNYTQFNSFSYRRYSNNLFNRSNIQISSFPSSIHYRLESTLLEKNDKVKSVEERDSPLTQAIKQLKEAEKEKNEKESIPIPPPGSPGVPQLSPEKTITSHTIEKKKPLMQRIKDELIHYWHGTKLLAKEIKISTRLVLKLMRGYSLTRREYRQVSSKCSIYSFFLSASNDKRINIQNLI